MASVLPIGGLMKIHKVVFDPQPVSLTPLADRRYGLDCRQLFRIVTDSGTHLIEVEREFQFDGRSGGVPVDLVVPNLGTQAECKSWLLHDALAYDIGLSFEETNAVLYWCLRYLCGYGWLRTKVVYWAVSASDFWFGEPEHGDWEYVNLGLVRRMALLPEIV
jgi:hypothetical protein